MTVECPRCGAPAEVHPSGELAAALDDTTVRVLGAPVARCVAGHLSPWPDDLADRIEARVDELLLAAGRRGLRRGDRCGECGTPLAMPPRRTDTPVSLPLDGHVVTVVLECPMVRCPDCGREQLPRRVADAIPRAVEAALDRAGKDA